MHRCNWQGVVNDHAYCITALPTQVTGSNVFVDVSAEEAEAFFHCRTLNLPFTYKGIQACRLKVNRALGQSAVPRYTQA